MWTPLEFVGKKTHYGVLWLLENIDAPFER